MTETDAQHPRDWRHDAYDALKRLDVRHVAYVPDAGLTPLIDACLDDDQMTTYVLTTEEEGIGVIAGADLGGERGVLLMQSSGVGNCPNGLTLVQNCGFPLLTLVTMRGEWVEFNPWQVAMGQATAPLLEMAGATVWRVDQADDVGETVFGAGATAFDSCVPCAVLFSQRLIGAKKF